MKIIFKNDLIINHRVQQAIEDLSAHPEPVVEPLCAAPSQDNAGGARVGCLAERWVGERIRLSVGAVSLRRYAHLLDHGPAIDGARVEQIR
ncbi:MAG: hypothetical protein ACLQBQ_08140, partial [Smithella sp.]